MIRYSLPEYPCKKDMWDTLKEEKRPIVVYGMGNGADKLIRRLDRYGVSIADFFASDGFVRGHSFHGKTVKSFSEIKAEYDDFVVLLSFASNREEVIRLFTEIDEKYDFYIPDMPVADEEEYFDRIFYNDNYENIKMAYDSLCDERSRKLFSAVINYKLTGKLTYLFEEVSEKSEIYSLLQSKRIENIIDAGAYNGDTLREAIEFFPFLKTVYAVEPDAKNFKKLSKYAQSLEKLDVRCINAAAWCDNTDGDFMQSGNRNSTVSATASFEHKSQRISLIRLDSVENERIDYIKYDVEGAEYEALIGSDGLIDRFNPVLLVSLYHRSRDIFFLTNYLKEKYPEYKLYLRRTLSVPAWEIALIMIP